jgi:hypothetical protein
VPHTHDDVGWLKTVDQYFYGARCDVFPMTQFFLKSFSSFGFFLLYSNKVSIDKSTVIQE